MMKPLMVDNWPDSVTDEVLSGEDGSTRHRNGSSHVDQTNFRSKRLVQQ